MQKASTDEENAENAFKKVFKYFKSKKPPPCLDSVLNPHNPDHSQHFTRVKNTASNCNLYEVPCRPGLAILPGWLDENEQLEWAERCLVSYSSSSNGSVRNIDSLGLGQGDWWQKTVKEPALLEKLRCKLKTLETLICSPAQVGHPGLSPQLGHKGIQ